MRILFILLVLFLHSPAFADEVVPGRPMDWINTVMAKETPGDASGWKRCRQHEDCTEVYYGCYGVFSVSKQYQDRAAQVADEIAQKYIKQTCPKSKPADLPRYDSYCARRLRASKPGKICVTSFCQAEELLNPKSGLCSLSAE